MPTLNLKPTHKIIKDYYSQLHELQKLGQDTEGNVAPLFAELLRKCARQVKWTLVEQYPMKRNRHNIRVDGALVNPFRIVQGIWEAKDKRVNFDNEIKKKFAAGYPKNNTLFQTPERAVIWQDGLPILDEDISNPDRLIYTLKVFFEHKPPAFERWEQAVEEFKEVVPELAATLLKLLEAERQYNKPFIQAFNDFIELCKQSINPNLSIQAVEEMLIQHLLTERIFSSVFQNPDFVKKNIIAREIEKVIDALTSKYFSKHEFLKSLDRFYGAIEDTARDIEDYSEKQTFLNTVYEKFFQGFSVKVADTHGVVYTPQPIVNFMVNSIEDILQKEFGRSLSDKGVHIMDPFVGTGNFILRVMREIKKTALPYKYAHELHCNEVMLLPYYIAAMNIEHEYYELTNDYQPFEGICLVDTFELAEDKQISLFTTENTERVERQKKSPIFVILGNPPYNAGQVNENDNNKNRKYEEMDKQIRLTYSKDSKATLVRKLNDPYIKAFKWATSRILENGEGIVAYVSNNSFVDDKSFDGMRKHVAQDFNYVFVLDLKGNIRKDSMRDEIPLGEKHTVFGLAAMVGISITFLIKKKAVQEHKIFYHSVHFRSTRAEKFDFVEKAQSIFCIDWQEITPDANYTWLLEGMQDEFSGFLSLGSKVTRGSTKNNIRTIFQNYSLGFSTNRDFVVLNFVQNSLSERIEKFCDDYNTETIRYQYSGKSKNIDDFLDYRKIQWSSTLKNHAKSGNIAEFDKNRIRFSLYRPYTKMHLYYDRILVDRPARFEKILPIPETEQKNQIISVSVSNEKPFSSLATNLITDHVMCGGFGVPTYCFPFYTYDEDGSNRRENLTDWVLAQFQQQYKNKKISKWDIFYYVYAILHHSHYREKYAANLRRELPRIPFAPEFWPFAEAGKKLADLHVHYENQPEYPLQKIESVDQPLNWQVEKMKLSKDKTQIIYNDFLTLAGIPAETFEYRLGNRSALDWIIDQYRVKTDKRSGIVNDPNREEDPQYIVRLIGKVITVSLETVKIVKCLSDLQ